MLSTDAEAWVELPVQDLGWVGIFPTPPRDQLSSTTSSPQQPEPDYRTQNPPPPPLLDPEFDQPATASGDAQAPDDPRTTRDDDADAAADDSSLGDILTSPVAVGAGVVLAPFALLAVFGGIVAFVKARRRKRRRERGAPHQRIANGWNEVTDLALDMGKPVPQSTTRREAAAFIGDSTTTLADRTDAAVWGGDELTDDQVNSYWDELSATLGSMKGQLGFVDRVKATTSIQSLRRVGRRGKQRWLRSRPEPTSNWSISPDGRLARRRPSWSSWRRAAGYSVAATAPGSYRLARTRRKMLVVKQVESVTVTISENRDGTRARIVGSVDSALDRPPLCGEECSGSGWPHRSPRPLPWRRRRYRPPGIAAAPSQTRHRRRRPSPQTGPLRRRPPGGLITTPSWARQPEPLDPPTVQQLPDPAPVIAVADDVDEELDASTVARSSIRAERRPGPVDRPARWSRAAADISDRGRAWSRRGARATGCGPARSRRPVALQDACRARGRCGRCLGHRSPFHERNGTRGRRLDCSLRTRRANSVATWRRCAPRRRRRLGSGSRMKLKLTVASGDDDG